MNNFQEQIFMRQKKSSRLNNFQKQIYMRQHFAVTESESEVHPSPATRAFSAPSRAGRPTKVKPLVLHGQVRGEMDAPVAACHMPHPFTEHIIFFF